jgi:hypothetical protein
MMLSVLVWLAMWRQVQKPQINDGDCYIVQAFSERGDGQSSSTPLTVCDSQPPKSAEHVIEIKTVRDDRKPAVGVEKPAPFPCNVNDGPYLTCITSSVTHWSCADKDHQLTGGVDEELYINPDHPNKPYCERVTRELWIDGTKFGVIKGLE